MSESERNQHPQTQPYDPRRNGGNETHDPLPRKDAEGRDAEEQEAAERPKSYLTLDPPPPAAR